MMESRTTSEKAQPGRRFSRRLEKRKAYGVLIVCGLLATLANAVLGDGVVPPFLRGGLTAFQAVAIGTVFLLFVAVFAWFCRDMIDEHEVRAIGDGQSAATAGVIVAYPVWYVLWRGGLVPEPSHEALYATLVLFSAGVFVLRKYA